MSICCQFLFLYLPPVTDIISREQLQNAMENPLAAAAATAAVDGTAPPPETQNNVENLLDIDFDGTAPASSQKEPNSGISGLEGLAGTPMRVASPSKMPTTTTTTTTAPSNNNMDDLMGVFGDGGGSNDSGGFGAPSGDADLMNGFSGLDVSGSGDAASADKGKKKNEDILDLF